MMCYKDMTFCSGNDGKCLSFSTCHRALTEQVWAKAKKCEKPISQFASTEKLECYKPPTETQDNDTN